MKLPILKIQSTGIIAMAMLPILPSLSLAQETSPGSNITIEEQVVLGVRSRLIQAGMLKDVIEQTEMIGTEALESSQSVSLSDALNDAPGADVAIDCSMCGFKRLRLNGLRAEHTNLLIDGLPAHTVVSGFYGLDSVSMTGVERIEIARGAGASLTAPEAIGGVVNVIIQEAVENGGSVEFAFGEEGYRQANLLGTLVSGDGATRTTLIGQFDQRDQADSDGNGVSENPLLDNMTLSTKISHDLSYTDNLTLRLTVAEQESFGGPVLGDTTSSIGAALDSVADGETDPVDLFANNDVRDRWLGNAWETTEWVDTSRSEATLSWLHQVDSDLNWQVSVSYADNEQDSFYEGYRYQADDVMYHLDGHLNYTLNDSHFVTLGLDYRDEDMDSEMVNAADPDFIFANDSFEHSTQGLYIQDTWTISDEFDVKMAVRLDKVVADFVAEEGTEIDETIVSPRVDARYFHTDAFTSRISAGTGYRAPLSFFESDHGLLDEPINMDIDDLEKSLSLGYALSYGDSRTTATASIARTEVENLATLGDSNTLTQKDEKGVVYAADFSFGYRISDQLLLNLVAEKYNYDSVFEDVYGIVPVEAALSLTLDYDNAGWDIYGTVNWVGSRNLAAFGYEGYNQIDADGYIIEDSVKASTAPSYYTLDFRVAKEVGLNWLAYVGVNNALDYTLAGDEDTPLFWVAGDEDGTGIQNDAFDVTYIYGPLRGREIYAGVNYSF